MHVMRVIEALWNLAIYALVWVWEVIFGPDVLSEDD
jgi:hypothetical protein